MKRNELQNLSNVKQTGIFALKISNLHNNIETWRKLKVLLSFSINYARKKVRNSSTWGKKVLI